MRPADQIALPLDWPQVGEDHRFIVSDANRAAFDHFRQWAMWPVKATILAGPRRSGRSLLARGFIDRVGGRLFDQAERHDEEELFHAWNQAQESGRPLVMITDGAAPWPVNLPDLRTRLAVTPVTRIDEPDDALVRRADQLVVRRSRAAYSATRRCVSSPSGSTATMSPPSAWSRRSTAMPSPSGRG